jgi:hypothetical protein
MRAMGDEELILNQPNIGIAILPLSLQALLPRQEILQITNRCQVVYLLEKKIITRYLLFLQPRLISNMHEFYLFEVVTNINPKLVSRVLADHPLHVRELVVKKQLNILRRVFFSFEVQTCEIEISRVDLIISSIALQESSCSMLLQGTSERASINVKPIPASLPASLLEISMAYLVE